MDELKERIKNLRFKIDTELASFKAYKELKYTVEGLTKELEDHTYDETDEKSVREYYAWLQEFYESRILVIDKSIIDNQNGSVFDNSDEDQMQRIHELEREIEGTFDYVNKNYPEFSKEYMEMYEKLKRDYQAARKEIKGSTKDKYDLSIGVAERPVTKKIFGKEHHLQEKPIFSLYGDVHTLTELFIHKLEAFNQSCGKIRIFNENDTKIKEVFRKAYQAIKDNDLLEVIRQIENNYIEGIRKSITDQFIFLGPDAIQEQMEEACRQVEELTKREIEKNCYFQVITDITLNTPINEIMTVLKYVEENHIFEDIFYGILYVLIEKEKYLLAKFNEEPKLYNLLSEKTRTILERIFINKISEYDEDEATAIIGRLKKQGYLYVFDKQCQDCFNSIRVDNKPTFELEERPYALYNIGGFSAGNYHRNSSNIKIIVSDRENLHITPKEYSDPSDKIYRCRFAYNLKEDMSDYIFYQDGYFSRKYTAINVNTGEENFIHTKGLIEDYVNGICAIHNGMNGDTSKISLYKIETGEQISFDDMARNNPVHVDYRKGLIFLVNANNNAMIFDNDLILRKTINIDELYEGAHIRNVNDGVITFCIFGGVGKESTYIYYDYVNMREIDRFDTFHNNNWIYSEGLYTYPDEDDKLVGYKKLSGEVCLKPLFERAGPFFGNMAIVKDGKDKVIIDRCGNLISFPCCLNYVYEYIREKYKDVPDKGEGWFYNYRHEFSREDLIVNYPVGKYEITDDYWKRYPGYVVIRNKYLFDTLTPIYYIDFSCYGNNKAK